MTPEQRQWVQTWLAEHDAIESGGYGLCYKAAHDMAEAFPSLAVVSGHALCLYPWGKRGHWWCVEPNGTIVDPTAKQFPAIGRYEPYTEGDDIRLGKCMSCGDEIWGSDPEAVYSTILCSKDCAESYGAYCSSPYG